MKAVLATLAAVAATALASDYSYTACEGDCGSASVISHCDEDIYFLNQPSEGPAIDQQVLKAGSSYSQVFTAMGNGCGWSMKFSPSSSFPDDKTQQYEYTWTGAGQPVWYDISYVNGKVYSDWEFTSSDDALCNPTDHAYRNSTDDQYGMQAACPSSVTLTLHLCPDQASGSLSASAASVATSAAASTVASSSAYVAPTTSTSAYVAPTTTSPAYVAPTTTASPTTMATQASTSASASSEQGYGNKVQVGGQGSIAYEVGSDASTTAVTVASTTVAPNGVVVTETQVEVVTAVQTMYVSARDAAPSPHAHRRRHEHRHPHNGRA